MVCINPCFGQGKFCGQIDTTTTKCYIKEKFPATKFGIEEKFRSVDSVFSNDNILLADMDSDCIPELIIPDRNYQNILIIDSKTGSTKWKIRTRYPYYTRCDMAVADADNDGIPELFLKTTTANFKWDTIGRLICYKADGTIKWLSDQKYYVDSKNEIGGKIALADFNQDGISEVYINNMIFNALTGVKLVDGGSNGIGTGFNGGLEPVPIAAQLDEDSTDLELAAGYTVYKVSITNTNGTAGNKMTAHNIKVNSLYRDGFTTVGDIDSDGKLDVVVTSQGVNNATLVYTYSFSNGSSKLIAQANPSGLEFDIGPPLVGDINGSGKPSILFMTDSKLHAYSYNGKTLLKQDWSYSTTDSSGSIGLTLFDFNNDGVKEIIYRDMTALNIVDGSIIPPKHIAKLDCFSGTWYEYPTVGDIDNSGHSKICVPCAYRTWPIGHLTVFGPPDSLPGWAPARGIWNQYNYHVLNINDDLTVPRVQKNNATYKNGKYNNFNVQESLIDSDGMYLKRIASLTGKIKSLYYNPVTNLYTVTFDLYNRADASARADSNLPVSFYNGDPATTGLLISTYHTLKKIEPGDSLLNLVYKFYANNLIDLFMVINTTRNKTGAFDPIDFTISECDYTDNTFHTIVMPKDEKGDPCNTSSIDSNLCYIKVKYPSSSIVVEKKIESEEGVSYSRTPLLADLDGDCLPEIIIGGMDNNQLILFNPLDGKTIKKIYTDYIGDSPSPFVIADVDNDGKIEIVLATYDGSFTSPTVSGKLVCFNLDGTIKWISDQKYDRGVSFRKSGAPAFADFNQDGNTEIYIHNSIFNAQTGVLICNGGNNGIGIQSGFDPITTYSSSPGGVSVAAQLDDDPSDLELAAGYTVYKVKITNPNGLLGNSMTPLNIMVDNDLRDGLTAVADINNDGILDVIVSSVKKAEVVLYTYSILNSQPALIAKKTFSNNVVRIGPPLIGKINDNGQTSIIVTIPNNLVSFRSFGLSQEWSMKVNDLSGDSQLTLFDLNGDGKNEIIYRDEGFLRIIDVVSSAPKEIVKVNCPAFSLHEGPIVGDLDNSGHSKICVSCFNKDSTFEKLYIFGPPDSLPGWAPARGIWNQYNYHVLNINDDLTVPRVQKNNATYKNGKYNNFYVQELLLDSNGMYLKRAASLTGKIKCINYDPVNDEYTVIFDIYNRADASFNADSSMPVSFYNGDPAAGGILIGTYYTLKKLESGDSLLNLEFKFSAANLSDLFMVVNTKRNASGQFDPTDFSIAECDYTDNIFHSPLPKMEKLNASICSGDTYQFYDTLLNLAGTYYHKVSTVNGCDSFIVNLELTIVDTVHTQQTIKACDIFTWNGQIYTQSGTFIHNTINRFGCDSITTLDLIINVSTNSTLARTACDSFIWNGNTYDKSGSYPYHALNVSGCDSVTTLELTINKSDDQVINHTACNNYTWNGQTYTQSGVYKFDTINRFGCDSAVTLDLIINSVINVSLVDAACDSYTWNGNTYTQSGTYQYKTINQQGCDSITTLQLTIHGSTSSTTAATACDSFAWNGNTYTQSGIYQYKTLNVAGCDSTATLELVLFKSSNSVTSLTTCDSITWNGLYLDQSGSYRFQTLNALGCDSIATLDLTINTSTSATTVRTACDRFTWNGNAYDNSGIYQYRSVNQSGCDSIINLNLTINKSTKADLAFSVCDSLNFLGSTLKANGNYIFMIQNNAGCDSVINLSLSIRAENFTDVVASCDTFRWNLNGQSYNKSGVYFQKYLNSFGCDSIYKLDLTIHKNYEELQQAEACKEYLWQVSYAVLKQSGEYVYPLKTINGCDSIIKLNLIVDYDFLKTDTVVSDSAYTWYINHQTYPVSGIYQERLTSNAGCDSIHQLFLIIKKNTGIYYPNVIRPGGPNGWFTIFDNGHTILSIETLTIYDRWGDLVWQKHGILPNELQMGWDGTFNGQKVLPGVYVWHAQLALEDGSIITEKGDVTVIR